MASATTRNASVHTLARPSKLVPAVVEALVERLHLAEFPAGTLLPKESVLCAEYGVSRTVIREALRVLEEKGLVDIRQGHGTVVTDVASWNLLDPLVITAQIAHDPTGTQKRDQLVSVRAAMESEMARVAARVMRRADHVELATLFDRLTESMSDPHEYLRRDIDFHAAIMRASGNQFAQLIVRSVHTWILYGELPDHVPPQLVTKSHRGHTAIYRAILERDEERSAAAMRAHILEGWAAKKRTITARAR